MASQIERLSDDIAARDLSVDAIVDTLTDRRCRTVLERFVRCSEPATVDELASWFPTDAVADSDADRSTRADRIALRLHHVVLPKLADAGLIEYDAAANVAELAEPPGRVEEYLRRTGRYGLA